MLNKKVKRFLSLAVIFTLALSLVSCSGSKDTQSGTENNKDIGIKRMRVLIGSSSTGGDSYQNADIISRHLENELGVNTKVDAIDIKQAFDELNKAKPDGSTILVFHDQSYLGVEYGSIEEKYSLENWKIGPTLAINPGDAFLARADAPFDTLVEAADWLEANENERLVISIQAGGVSQIGFDAFYNWVKENYDESVTNRVKAYVTGSQSDKNQSLWDGNANIINGSVIGNEEYTKDGVSDDIKMKFIGLTGKERQEGIDAPTFAEQGINVNGEPFSFDKEFFVIFPKDIDENFYNMFNEAVAQIIEKGDYEKDLIDQNFVLNYRSAEDAEKHLLEKRETIRKVLENTPNLDDITS